MPAHSAAEKSGLSLGTIEKLGLLSKLEALGALTIATDKSTPGALTAAGLLLLLVGPAAVFVLPDSDVGSLALQAVIALTCAVGGAAAIGGGALVGKLQK